jgi:hypothetical protein
MSGIGERLIESAKQADQQIKQEQRRARFEAIIAEHYYLKELPRNSHDGEYADSELQVAWEVFDAALDSVAVELPERCRPVGHDYVLSQFDASVSREEGYDSALDDCREAITAAGVRVKP